LPSFPRTTTPGPPPIRRRTDDARSIDKCREDFETYATVKAPEIDEQREAWRYYHGRQFTDEQLDTLSKRGQPAIMFARVSKKIDGLVGVVMRLRGDPKGYPRGPSNEDAAELATQCIRAVMDGSMFPTAVESDCIRDAAVHGFGVEEIYLEPGREPDPDVCLSRVDPVTFYYDPRSVRQDFSDARFLGVSKWATPDDIDEMFPGKGELVENEVGDFQTAFDTDRELLWQRAPNRTRLVEHWYKQPKGWRVKYFAGLAELDDRPSPFMDDRGKSIARFNPFAWGIDHDGIHYGLVRMLKGPQDAMNQHRTKAVHIMNTRQLLARKGALGPDIERQRIEAARPDGVLEIEGEPGKDVLIEKADGEFLQQTKYFEDARQELEDYGPNPALVGDQKAPSGRALTLLQQAGLSEIGPFLSSYRGWKLRTYKLIWSTVKENWKQERIIRVADPESEDGKPLAIPLNAVRSRVVGPDGQPQLLPPHDPQAAMGQPVMLNNLGRADVDIILDDGPDTTNVMGDVFDVLSALAQNNVPVPPQVLIKASALPASNKRELIGELSKPPPPPPPPPPNPTDQAKVEVEMRRLQLDEQKLLREQQLEPQRMALEADKNQLAREQLASEQHLGTVKAAVDHAKVQADVEKVRADTSVKTTEAKRGSDEARRGQAESEVTLGSQLAPAISGLVQQMAQLSALSSRLLEVAQAPVVVQRDATGAVVGAQKDVN
jgi:hypothetical protein